MDCTIATARGFGNLNNAWGCWYILRQLKRRSEKKGGHTYCSSLIFWNLRMFHSSRMTEFLELPNSGPICTQEWSLHRRIGAAYAGGIH